MGARGSLRGRQHHPDQTTQGLHGIEELGDEARQAERDEEGQGGAGTQNRRHYASDAGRWHEPVMSRRPEWRSRMTQIMMARYAPGAVKPRAGARRRGGWGL